MNRTIPTSERRRRFAKVLSPLLPYVPITWKTTAKGLLHRVKPAKRRTMTKAEEDRVRLALGPAIDRFAREYNFDTSSWLRFRGVM